MWSRCVLVNNWRTVWILLLLVNPDVEQLIKGAVQCVGSGMVSMTVELNRDSRDVSTGGDQYCSPVGTVLTGSGIRTSCLAG